jgi:multicomponent Na+:H+ antiporter subunit F
MIAIFLTWTLTNPTSIGYEVALLAAIAGGVLPTLSMARIISKGRR